MIIRVNISTINLMITMLIISIKIMKTIVPTIRMIYIIRIVVITDIYTNILKYYKILYNNDNNDNKRNKNNVNNNNNSDNFSDNHIIEKVKITLT